MNLDNLQNIQSNFIQELTDASKELPSSLPFIIHETHSAVLVNENEAFQVIVIGGTVAVSAIVKKNGEQVEIISQKKIGLPSFARKDEFLTFMGRLIDKNIRVLALNFAYPLTPIFENGKLDGRLISGTKGQGFVGLIGEKIGETLEAYILETGHRKISVTVANDTVCLLLSGLQKTSWENLGAGIVGTGMNLAFCLSQNTLVNLESANFNKFQQSDAGVKVDIDSLNPGKSLYEKEVAGRYLYKHFNAYIQNHDIKTSILKTTEEMDKIARGSRGELTELARNLFIHSAQLIACQVAAIMEFRKTNMMFVMEGSLFWRGYKYKDTVEAYLKQLTSYKAEFTEIENSEIVGAAYLVV